MFCKHCGNRLPEGANFCPECGKVSDEATEKNNSNEQKAYDNSSYESVDPFKSEKESLGGSILTFSILGLAFTCTFCLSVLGLIFAIISRTKLNSYVRRFGETEGRATVGKHLGIAALISSIIMTVILCFYVIILIGGILSALMI